MSPKLLEVKNLQTHFNTQKGVIKAVDGISFTINEGKTLGIVGESGSGKSQMAMSILKLFARNQTIAGGTIEFENQVISEFTESQIQKIRGNKISIIFQEPMTSLNPVFTVKKQLVEVLTTHQNISRKEALTKVIQMLKAVKIPNYQRVLKSYPHQLSGGMSQRVMIAMALSCNPKLLIADEATTALDVIVQAEILKLMNELKDKYHTAILFITHDLGVVSQMADDVIVMYRGKIVESAPVNIIFKEAKHPYTKRLLAAFLKTDISSNKKKSTKKIDLFEAENEIYDFSKFKNDGFVDDDYFEVGPNHFVACHLKNRE